MTEEKEKYFETPGLKQKVNDFKALLKASLKEDATSSEEDKNASSEKDHILIIGPRGVGKSLFLQICMEQLKKGNENIPVCMEQLKKEIENIPVRNCAAFATELVDSELFGHKRGAFTGASKDKDGLIKAAENDGVVILEEVNSLPLNVQAKLLVYLEKFFFYPLGSNEKTSPEENVRIIATSNFEEGTKLREDFRDRFKVVVDIPPLHERRSDIFYFIAKKYPDLKLMPSELLIIFCYNWPGNLRELDRVLFELNAGVRPAVIEKYMLCMDFGKITEVLSNYGLSIKKFKKINNDVFRAILPIDYEDIIVNNRTRAMAITISMTNEDSQNILLNVNNKKESRSIDPKTLEMFFAIIYGDSALTSEKPIWENNIFEKTTKYLGAVDNKTGYSTLPLASDLPIYDPPWLALTEACEKAGKARQKKAVKLLVNNELESPQIAKYLLSDDEHFPSLLRALAREAKQNRISEMIGVSTKTMSRWLKYANNETWPPPVDKRRAK